MGDLLINAHTPPSGQNSKKRSYLSLNKENDIINDAKA